MASFGEYIWSYPFTALGRTVSHPEWLVPCVFAIVGVSAILFGLYTVTTTVYHASRIHEKHRAERR